MPILLPKFLDRQTEYEIEFISGRIEGVITSTPSVSRLSRTVVSIFGIRRYLRWYEKTSYINQNEIQEPLEPWSSSDPRNHEGSSPNWGAGMP
jgi:hypothetical protein